MNRGYIKLWRSSTDNPLYFAETFTKWQAWVDLLILANHKSGMISIRGNVVKIDAGQIAASRKFLGKRWKWSEGKVLRFLKLLETEQQIVQQKSTVVTIYSIVRWEAYQSNGTTDGGQTVQQTEDRRYTPKNDKNVENDKNNTPLPPEGGDEEVEKNPDPKTSPSKEEDLRDFDVAWGLYQRKGNKMAAIRYWRKLNLVDRAAITKKIPAYQASMSAKKYWKDFQGWINPSNRMWEDELVSSKITDSRSTAGMM